jgi:hypothetical protein
MVVKEFRGYQDSLHHQIDRFYLVGWGFLERLFEGNFVLWEAGFQVSSRNVIGNFELLHTRSENKVMRLVPEKSFI